MMIMLRAVVVVVSTGLFSYLVLDVCEDKYS
jgi:hypothetical protein